MAGPFDSDSWDHYIPAEKKLHPDWVASLFARGTPAVYTKRRDELRHIGMPVGGLCCGTLYLSGDGRLWNWDIFNQKTEGILPRQLRWTDIGMDFQTGDPFIRPRDGATYVKPAVPADSQDIAQGFAIRISVGDKTETRRLDASAWEEISFTGQYPIGTIDYADPASPVKVRLEAFSPFAPHQVDDSSIPGTVFHFTVTNQGREKASIALAGWLQNATSFYSAKTGTGRRLNNIRPGRLGTFAQFSFAPENPTVGNARPDLLLEDFEHGYGRWKVEGSAFGSEPIERSAVPSYQGDLGGEGSHVANSHASAPGRTVGEKDAQTGRLVSAPFKVERKFLSFYIGGGRREDVGLRLLIESKTVRTAHGRDSNHMQRASLDLSEFEGQEAVIEIFDNAQGGWANVGVDHIVQTDHPKTEEPIDHRPDFGTMVLASLGGFGRPFAHPDIARQALPESAFTRSRIRQATGPAPIACVGREFELGPGQSASLYFVITWHFPNTNIPVPDARSGNYYARRFPDALAAATYLARDLARLEGLTRLWRDTWYDSTLPHWFLDRTLATASTLATTTSHRLGTGRFWGWEGIGCCEGTCTHVWHYAQAVGRLFPKIERDLRERVDFGAGFDVSQGMIRHRAEGTGPAIDGQCGRILGVWREHQMSTDRAFLDRIWPKVKQAVEYVLRHDVDGDGILDGAQENTLDAAWYGQISWITSLAIAALRAAEEMAREQNDLAFAERCQAQHAKARASVEKKLFNGEYFIQIADPNRPKSLGTYEACHIDQLHGQSWAWQVNLGRILDRDKTVSALRALWKYNFAPDVGPFRKKFTAGRPYTLAGEAGLVMTSNPKLIPNVFGLPSWQIGYFNECMSGFEHQAASHMIAEGLVLEGLAVTRAIHDRYHPARRNPYNEIECSDHYARAMASYGSFISICGFESHGPKGQIGFAPRVTPENFRAPFTAAGGWGTYAQQRSAAAQNHTLEVKHGRIRLKTFACEIASGARVHSVTVHRGGKALPALVVQTGARAEVILDSATDLSAGTPLHIDCLLA